MWKFQQNSVSLSLNSKTYLLNESKTEGKVLFKFIQRFMQCSKLKVGSKLPAVIKIEAL